MGKDKDNYYVNPNELESELIKLKETGKVSEKLGQMFHDIASNMLYNSNWINYTNHWKSEMKSEAILHLCKYSHNFDPDYEYSNAFAYCSQICRNAFVQVINREKQEQEKVDNLHDELHTIISRWEELEDRCDDIRNDEENDRGDNHHESISNG